MATQMVFSKVVDTQIQQKQQPHTVLTGNIASSSSSSSCCCCIGVGIGTIGVVEVQSRLLYHEEYDER